MPTDGIPSDGTANPKRVLNLRDFKIPLNKLASVSTFRTRQGDRLSYRIYPALSETMIILYHGVGGDSRYMCVLASALAAAGVGTVVTPDFRGHGESLNLTADMPINQLEIDLEELLIHLKMQRSFSKVILGGHSLGGGFALRVAVSALASQFLEFVALAPYLPPSFGLFYEGLAGWIQPDVGDAGFTVMMPPEYITGQEKLHYSENYLAAVTPAENLLKALAVKTPLVTLVVGAEDELVQPRRYEELLGPVGIPVNVLPELNHLTLVSKPESYLSLFKS